MALFFLPYGTYIDYRSGFFNGIGSRCPLPVAFPVPANLSAHRIADQRVRQCAVVSAAIVFQPCRVVRVLVKVLRANVVVLTNDYAAQTQEIAFDHVGVLTVVAVNLRVIHALNIPYCMEYQSQRVTLSIDGTVMPSTSQHPRSALTWIHFQ